MRYLLFSNTDLADFAQSVILRMPLSTIGAHPIATASTRQYHADTPLGGLPCDN